MPIELVSELPKQSPRQAQPDPFKAPRDLVRQNLSGVRKVVAVHSGKGGVGKSFFAVNLAAALAMQGFKVGLVDADVDCPSCHRMLGNGQRVYADENQRLVPLEAHGIKFLSIGNMVDDEDSANIMRGPIMFKLISGMLQNGDWGTLDYMVIDLPPGTGDNPLTIMQIAPLDGLIIVTQPQEIALADARKSADMAGRMGVKVLGVAENMSGEVFGTGGAEAAARKLGLKFLGTVPLLKSVRENSDAGIPPVLRDKEVMEIFEGMISEADI